MKGIILAGGSGTRLRPCTLVVGKQLLPVYDKPMVYYPLSTLIHAGVDDILIVTTPEESAQFKKLLNDGKQFGISISYLTQEKPEGIAQGIQLAERFIQNEPFWFILGDNLFHGPSFGTQLSGKVRSAGCTIFAYRVADPSAYGVVTFKEGSDEVESIVEKPIDSLSKWAIPGLYYFDETCSEKARFLKPSSRGEVEILALVEKYLEQGTLNAIKVSRGNAWFDLGTAANLLQAANFVQTIQTRQGLLIGSPEEASALRHDSLSPRISPDISSSENEYYSLVRNSLL